jgi:hypothetical protein
MARKETRLFVGARRAWLFSVQLSMFFSNWVVDRWQDVFLLSCLRRLVWRQQDVSYGRATMNAALLGARFPSGASVSGAVSQLMKKIFLGAEA